MPSTHNRKGLFSIQLISLDGLKFFILPVPDDHVRLFQIFFVRFVISWRYRLSRSFGNQGTVFFSYDRILCSNLVVSVIFCYAVNFLFGIFLVFILFQFGYAEENGFQVLTPIRCSVVADAISGSNLIFIQTTEGKQDRKSVV